MCQMKWKAEETECVCVECKENEGEMNVLDVLTKLCEFCFDDKNKELYEESEQQLLEDSCPYCDRGCNYCLMLNN